MNLQNPASTQIETLSSASEEFLRWLRAGLGTALEWDSQKDLCGEFMPLECPAPKNGTKYALARFRLGHCPGTPSLEFG